MKRLLRLNSVFFIFLCAGAQDDFRYQLPPKDLQDLVLAKPTPSVAVDDKAEWLLLLERSDYPTIEEMAQPELRIAGQRINPNNFGPSRAASFNGIRIRNIKKREDSNVEGLPADLRASSVQWSPDQRKFAFVHSANTYSDLYVVDLDTRKAVKINKNPLNTVLGAA